MSISDNFDSSIYPSNAISPDSYAQQRKQRKLKLRKR
jgi:hypothetical protein